LKSKDLYLFCLWIKQYEFQIESLFVPFSFR